MLVGRMMAAAALALALGACGGSSDEPEAPAPSLATATSAAAGKPVSIIRPDIETERAAPPLGPLGVRVRFSDGGAALDQAAQAELATVLDSPQLKAGGPIVLSGHSDSAGGDAANMRASLARAEAVRDWLVERGVDQDRIRVIALGEQNPVAPNAKPDGSPNEEGRAANRRVEVSIAVAPETPAAEPLGEGETLVDELTR